MLICTTLIGVTSERGSIESDWRDSPHRIHLDEQFCSISLGFSEIWRVIDRLREGT